LDKGTAYGHPGQPVRIGRYVQLMIRRDCYGWYQAFQRAQRFQALRGHEARHRQPRADLRRDRSSARRSGCPWRRQALVQLDRRQLRHGGRFAYRLCRERSAQAARSGRGGRRS